MNKAHGINLYPFSMWLNFGWYPGDPFELFRLTILEANKDYKGEKIDFVTIFSVKITHLLFAFGWHKKEG